MSLAATLLETQEEIKHIRMDAADDDELLEALAIMFTVITFGLLVITAVFRTPRHISALPSVFAAFGAWGLIRVKMLNFWLQRTGRLDQMFSLMQIHLLEIASFLMLLLILLFSVRPNRPNYWQGACDIHESYLFLTIKHLHVWMTALN